MNKSAFVTGGTGFLGLNLIEQLVAGGWSVVALCRAKSNRQYLAPLGITLAEGDVTDAPSVHKAMPERVDAVFHVAGDTSLSSRGDAQQDRVNIGGTHNMVETALARGARRFIHTSSISAYGLQRGRIDETAPQLGGVSWINYQRSKFRAEDVVRAALARGLDAVIMNPASILGRADTGGWARLIRRAVADKLPGVPPGAQSFCHVGEVARAHIAAVEHGHRGENYLLGGADASFLELVRTIGDVTGHKVPSRVTPAFLLRGLGYLSEWTSYLTGKPPTLTPESSYLVTRYFFCDDGKAARELGYRAVDLRRMVEESYLWLQQEGFLPQ